MGRKITRKGLVKKIKSCLYELVKKRDGNICQKCGKYVTGQNCHPSHVIPVSISGMLKYDLKNIKILCFHCHMNWWHKNPTESGEWFKKKFPKRWAYLEERKHQRKTWKLWELEELYEELKEQLE